MGDDTCPWHDACAKWPDCYPPDSIGAQLEDLVDRLAEVVGQEWRDEISRQVWAPFREAQARSLAIVDLTDETRVDPVEIRAWGRRAAETCKTRCTCAGYGCRRLASWPAPTRDHPPVEDLIEASSLGTPEAQALRESVSLEDARRVVERAKRMTEDPS